jgi:hypothetical protein
MADDDLQRATAKIPVFPSVAFRAITLLDNVDANLNDVEALVASDQT